jgi:hypothetical protein
MSSQSLFLLLDCVGADGRFDDTACVLLNTKGDMIGTRVSGPVSSELRDIPGGAGGPAGRWSKILSLAPKVSLFITSEKSLADLQII